MIATRFVSFAKYSSFWMPIIWFAAVEERESFFGRY